MAVRSHCEGVIFGGQVFPVMLRCPAVFKLGLPGSEADESGLGGQRQG